MQPCVALSSDPRPSGAVLFLPLVFWAEGAAGLISEGSLCEPRRCGALVCKPVGVKSTVHQHHHGNVLGFCKWRFAGAPSQSALQSEVKSPRSHRAFLLSDIWGALLTI